jgi:hypothetical protein
VVAWGAGTNNTGTSPNFGQAQVPVGLSNVVAIAGGAYHSLALQGNGTVVAWGAGTNNTGTSPNFGQAVVPVGLSNVVAIAAGSYHSVALKADGTVVIWGAGTNNTGSTPNFGQAVVPVGLSNGLALAGGGFHTLVLEGNGSPSVTVQPVSQTVPAGATVQLVGMAVGLQPLNYQWQLDGTNLAGATAAVLSLAGVQLANAGTYSVTVSNAAGTVVSSNALLSVLSPPVISGQPSGQTVIAGAPVLFSVAAAGSPPLGYQWQFNSAAIVGATQSSYSLASADPTNAGTYSVVVSNAYGVAVSSNAVLTVLCPPAITTQPANRTALVGDKPSFTVTATGTTPLAYQWAFDGTNLAGASTDTLLLTNVQPAQAGGYAVVITNVAGSITSSVASLTVLQSGSIISLSLAEPTISLTFLSVAGSNYLLEYKSSLTDPAWTPLPPAVAGTGGVIVLPDTNPPVASRFYRVLSE